MGSRKTIEFEDAELDTIRRIAEGNLTTEAAVVRAGVRMLGELAAAGATTECVVVSRNGGSNVIILSELDLSIGLEPDAQRSVQIE